MTNRVTAEEVKVVFDTQEADATVEAFIGVANRMVTANLSGELNDDILTDIELFLSCHFLSCKDPRTSEESDVEVSAKFTAKYGKGFESTTYGQMALSLDSTGILINLGKSGVTVHAVVEDYYS